MDEEREELWERLKRWFNNATSRRPVTREFIIMSARGQYDKIDWSKIPPESDDFPFDVQLALNHFNKLGDNTVADVGYLGKNYTLLPTLIEMEPPHDEELYMEAMLRIDELFIKKSQDDMKAARERAKRNGKS